MFLHTVSVDLEIHKVQVNECERRDGADIEQTLSNCQYICLTLELHHLVWIVFATAASVQAIVKLSVCLLLELHVHHTLTTVLVHYK